MNKQELIKIYEDTSCTLISINGVLEDLRQLDEPKEKVTLPRPVGKLDLLCERTKQDFTFCARKCTRRSESLVL